MKTYQDGEIYFIRETEYPSGKLSAFVKIGLVRYKEDRDSYGRLSEHQTGNPRRLCLDDDHIVKTQAVDMVEAQLHRRFAKSRISGEWFELEKETDLQIAIEEAKKLSGIVNSYMPKFEGIIALANKPSHGVSREARPQEVEWINRLVIARKQSSVCGDVEDEIKDFLRKSVAEGNDVGVAAKNGMRNYKPIFDYKDFELKQPKLWAKYQTTVETWDSTFSPAFRAKDLGAEFEASIASARKILTSVQEGMNFSEIVEANLILTNLKGLADWEAKVAEAELKDSFQLDEKVKGVATWKRWFKPAQKFDEATFAEENPDLYKTFIYTPKSTPLVNLKKTKG